MDFSFVSAICTVVYYARYRLRSELQGVIIEAKLRQRGTNYPLQPLLLYWLPIETGGVPLFSDCNNRLSW